MTEIFVVVGFGGQYDDAWEHSIRAFHEEAQAIALIENYDRWLTEIRSTDLPESLQEYNWDFDDERAGEMYEVGLQEFKFAIMDDLGVPEHDREWLLDNWDNSYDCDRPNYKIDKLELA